MRKDYKTLRERKIQEIEDKLRKLKEINKGHRDHIPLKSIPGLEGNF